MKLLLLIVSTFALLSGPALADHHKSCEKCDTEMSAEKRQHKADKYEKMAECLRSDKPMGECRQEMRASHGGDCDKGSHKGKHGKKCNKKDGESCGHHGKDD